MALFSKIAPFLTHPLALVGFALFLVVGVLRMLLKTGVVPQLSKPAGSKVVQQLLRYLFYVAVLVVVLGFGLEWWRSEPAEALYRIQVTVLDLQGRPATEARVSSDLGGDITGADGRFVIELPATRKPANGQLTVRASHEAAFLAGSETVTLGEHFQLQVTLQLVKSASAQISGKVIAASGDAVEGALVTLAGHPEQTRSDANGYFTLPAHAARGQMVSLHAEKDGVGSVDQSHPASDHPVTLTLESGH